LAASQRSDTMSDSAIAKIDENMKLQAKEKRANAEYLKKLNESIAQAKRGEVVKYTMDELKTLVGGE